MRVHRSPGSFMPDTIPHWPHSTSQHDSVPHEDWLRFRRDLQAASEKANTGVGFPYSVCFGTCHAIPQLQPPRHCFSGVLGRIFYCYSCARTGRWRVSPPTPMRSPWAASRLSGLSRVSTRASMTFHLQPSDKRLMHQLQHLHVYTIFLLLKLHQISHQIMIQPQIQP